MSDDAFQLIAMIGYLVGMLAIGYFSFKRTSDLDDYMLGGRGLSAPVTALSAGAADMSGWLLMGLPGALYATGLVEAWIAIGLTIGAWMNWKFVAPRLRAYTVVAGDSITVPSFLENRLHDHTRIIRVAAGLIILGFFTFYVSSGMVAGGVFFESSFDTGYHTGLLVVAGVTVAYTLFGGFLAVSYTDFVQGLLMFLALIAVPTVAVISVGGPGEVISTVTTVNPNQFSLLQGASFVGVVSSLAWGLGYVGQPHVIVRFMAIRSVEDCVQGRRIGIGWMILSLTGAVVTGLSGLAYFTKQGKTLDDPETVFIALGQLFFHPLLAGLMLAAVLAAIMSTISSQLIVCSAALVEDLYLMVSRRSLGSGAQVMLGRLAVLVVALVAGVLAWEQSDTILALVSFAWAGFGAAFGPTVVLSLFWRRLTALGAGAGMVVGAVTVAAFGNLDGGPFQIFDYYELLPGFVFNLLVAVAVSLTSKPAPQVQEEFDRTLAAVGRDRAPQSAPGA